jgi:hypothetical protein
MASMRAADLASIFRPGGGDVAKPGSPGKRHENRGCVRASGISRKHLISNKKIAVVLTIVPSSGYVGLLFPILVGYS